VANHAFHDEWCSTQANGVSHATHCGLPTLCGASAIGVFGMQKRPDGRRKYLACSDVRVTARQIVQGYRLRWAVELFHKDVKQNLGFEDVATSGFDSVEAHVHWVYCAYILLHMSPPGVPADVKSIGDKKRRMQTNLAHKEKRRILQKLTRIGGVESYKEELRQALEGT